MSIKKLFDKRIPQSIVASTDLKKLSKPVESSGNVKQKIIEKNRFIPQKDYSRPETFAHFGSALKYYSDSFNRVLNQYPYDGSLRERTEFFNNSTYLDLYIYDNVYPRTTGYVSIAADGGDYTGGHGGSIADYPLVTPGEYEYILFHGGPNAAPTEYLNKPLAQQFPEANIYDPATNRESNLEFNNENGMTIEFWLKKDAWSPLAGGVKTKEVVCDMAEDITGVQLRNKVCVHTGSGGISLNIFQNDATAGPAAICYSSIVLTDYFTEDEIMHKWHHYAVTSITSGSIATPTSGTIFKWYVDGELLETDITSHILTTSGSFTYGTLGALVAGDGGAGPTATQRGDGKLTGSLDEFRYWKRARTAEEIGRFWFTQYGGGTNTDLANTDLGVYFKFNEGITGRSSVDSTVLDYSGRISNGEWTGYNAVAGSRNTGSAIDIYLEKESEFRDPIIYSFHPQVMAAKTSLESSGSAYDLTNNASFYYTMPTWIIEEDDESGQELLKLSQILSSYLDTLYLQIENYPKLKDITYAGATTKPLPFSYKLLEGYGLSTSEIFVDATILEQISDRDEKMKFDLDLTDIKNLIYKNIYNNLAYIYKSKGNMKAFRNLMRCYGIDTDLIKINLYGDNSTYRFRNNYEIKSVRKKYIDFNDPTRFKATIYQQTASGNPSSVSFITGSGFDDFDQQGYTSMTLESEIIFPRKLPRGHQAYFDTPFLTASLFGFHSLSTSAGPSATDFTWPATEADWDIRAYAVREELESNNVRFVLTSSQPSSPFLLTSSLFYDVYDNEKWNFAVRVSPEKVGGNLVSGTAGPGTSSYKMEFYGVNTEAGAIKNDFLLVTGSMPFAGAGYLVQAKRAYAGAERFNTTGALLNQTDIKLGGVRYWASYLDNTVINLHAQDPENYGSLYPHKSTYLYPDDLAGVKIPQMETLALNWGFDILTGSNAAGICPIPDLSSGSIELSQRYRSLGPVVNLQHTAEGNFFPANSSKVLDTRFVYSGKQTIPENIQSADMINIGETDKVFKLTNRPIEYFLAIEKSMYQSISEEILDIFATIVEFNVLIGDPVNRYRQEYKQLGKLRQLFFEKVQNEPDLDRYIEFYKWIDNSLSTFLNQLIPASAAHTENLRVSVESHILERNKYWTKFPTIDSMIPELIASVGGGASGGGSSENNNTNGAQCYVEGDNGEPIEVSCADEPIEEDYYYQSFGPIGGEEEDATDGDSPYIAYEITHPGEWETDYRQHFYDYSQNRHPTDDDPEHNQAWWYRRAKRSTEVISSGDPEVDADREVYRKARLRGLSGGRRRVYSLRAQQNHLVDGGTNRPYDDMRENYVKNALPHVSDPDAPTADGIYIAADNIQPDTSEVSFTLDPRLKRKIKYSVFKTKGDLSTFSDSVSYESGKGARFVPFTMLHSEKHINVYSEQISADLSYSVEIVNMHDDSYGTGTPLQGPFTERFVGGKQYRHVDLNRVQSPLNDDLTRLEGWQITSSTGVVKIMAQPYNRPRGALYRGLIAKSPVNIQNIKQVPGSVTRYVSGTLHANIGNFEYDYDIVQAPGRTVNNRAWVRKGPWNLLNDPSDTHLTASTFVGGMFDSAKIQRGRTEHVMVCRFSSPGDPSTMGDSNGGPGLDRYAAEFSPNNQLNWRNRMVRDPLINFMLTPHVNQFGYYSGVPELGIPGSTVNAQNYSGTGSFYQINRNSRMAIKQLADGSTVTGTVHDNYWVQHPIPATDLRYAWITASLESITPYGFDYWPKNFYVPSLTDPSLAPVTFSPSGTSLTSDFGQLMDYAGLHQLMYEPIPEQYTSAKCFNPLCKPPVSKKNTANATEASNFDYGDIINYEVFGIFLGGVFPFAENVLNLHRNGPYQYPSWKQTRAGQHPIARYLRKNNFLGCVKDTTTALYYEPPVQKRSLSLTAMLGVKPDLTGTCQGTVENVVNLDVSLINAYSFANFELKGCAMGLNSLSPVLNQNNLSPTLFNQNEVDPNGQTLYQEPGLMTDTGYGPLSEMIHNMGCLDSPITSLIEIVYSAPVYPAPKNKFSAEVRKRNDYSNTFWRSSRPASNIVGSKKFIDFSALTSEYFPEASGTQTGYNSQGKPAYWPNPNKYPETKPIIVQSAWALDANDDFMTAPSQSLPLVTPGLSGGLPHNANSIDYAAAIPTKYGGSTLGHPGELQNNYSQCYSSIPATLNGSGNRTYGFTSRQFLSCSVSGTDLYPTTITPLRFGARLFNPLLDASGGLYAQQFGDFAVGNGATTGTPNAYTLSAWVSADTMPTASQPAGLSGSKKYHIISFSSADHARPVTPTPGTCSVRLFLTGNAPESNEWYVGMETVISRSAGFGEPPLDYFLDAATSSVAISKSEHYFGSNGLWHHLLLCYDAAAPGDQSTGNDRFKLYINGELTKLGDFSPNAVGAHSPLYGSINASTGAIGNDVSYNTDIGTLTGSSPQPFPHSYFINNVFNGRIADVSFFNYSIHTYNPDLVEKMYNCGIPPALHRLPVFDDYTLRPIGWYRMGSENDLYATPTLPSWYGPVNEAGPCTNPGSASWDPDFPSTPCPPTSATSSRLVNAVSVYWPDELGVYPVTASSYLNPFYSRGDGYTVSDVSLTPGVNTNMDFDEIPFMPPNSLYDGYFPSDKSNLIAAPLYNRKHTLKSFFSVGQFVWDIPTASFPAPALGFPSAPPYWQRTTTTPLPQTSASFEYYWTELEKIVKLGLNRAPTDDWAWGPNWFYYPHGPLRIGGGQAIFEAGTNAGYIENGTWVPSPSQPFYDSYAEYNVNLRLKNQDKSILPEFIMSDQIDFYMNKQKGDFLAQNDSWLSIPGATGTIPYNSSQDGFLEIFSHSDFLKNFSLIKADLKGDVINPSAITLKCSALKKPLFRDGFFCAERGLQLSSQFSQSYFDNLNFTGLDANLVNARARPFLAPFFSPGIFFNVMKSRMALSYPVMSDKPHVVNYKIFQKNALDISEFATYKTNLYALGTQQKYVLPRVYEERFVNEFTGSIPTASWDHRIPFEALVEPERYAAGFDIYDLETGYPEVPRCPLTTGSSAADLYLRNPDRGRYGPFIRSSLDVAANWNGEGDRLYSRMAHNFLAASTEIFLPKGEFSNLQSLPESRFLPVVSGTAYAMRFKVYRTTTSPRVWYDYGRRGSVIPWGDVPQDPRIPGTGWRETFTWAPTRPSAWGPPVAGTTYLGFNSDAAQVYTNWWEPSSLDIIAYNTDFWPSDCLMGHNECFMPAPHQGEGWVDCIFNPTHSGPVSIDEIFAQAIFNYWRIDPLDNSLITGPTGSFSTGSLYDTPRKQAIWSTCQDVHYMDSIPPMSAQYANAYAMQVDSTFNLLGKKGDRWVIEPKYEMPMFNYHSNSLGYKDVTLGNPDIIQEMDESYQGGFNPATTPIGGWTGFGTIETERGVYYEVGEIPQGWLDVRGAVTASTFNMEKLSGIDMSAYKNSKFEDLSKLVGFTSADGSRRTRMGNLAESWTAWEAVVAVPFVVRGCEREFFEIPVDTIRKALGELNTISSDKAVSKAEFAVKAAVKAIENNENLFEDLADQKAAKVNAAANAAGQGAACVVCSDDDERGSPPQTIKDMVSKMKKYVFPPRMDFVTNPEDVTPFAMYIFEFSKTFDQNDLAYIAQNLYPPVSEASFEEAEASISHKLLANELMGSFGNGENDPIKDGLQWMVFKVKQRANNNYFSKVAKESGIKTQQFPYSYNWPYDFMSLIEFADLDVKIGFGKGVDDGSLPQKVAEIQEDPLVVATSKK